MQFGRTARHRAPAALEHRNRLAQLRDRLARARCLKHRYVCGVADLDAVVRQIHQLRRTRGDHLEAFGDSLGLPDLQGGTFSITNGGIYGSMMSTPLLNYPQTGILGMHNIVKRAVVVGDEVKVRPMMYVALSYDHRVVDGREAVSFLVAVKDRLEAPDHMLLEV